MLRPTGLAFAVAAVAMAAPALADGVRVVFGDLDLSSASDQQVLGRRIETQARHWCAHETPKTGSTIQPTRCVAIVRQAVVERLPFAVQSAYAAARRASPDQFALNDPG